ncbi:MAG: DUF4838 domain-containing protein [Armatimonadetes bacterium]|nr:DUF4838 domain-containing protein [Armatimonadota bacterium]
MLRLIASMLALGCILTPAAAAKMTLTTDGKTAYSILIDPDASGPEQWAAGELRKFLYESTGAEFEIKKGTSVGFEPVIIVGPGKAARSLVRNIDFDKLGAEEFIIESRLPHLVLAGGRPRGTLYAVYSFLEDVVGCRWWTSTASTIPNMPTLTFQERHDRQRPILEYREPFWWDAFDGDWAVRNRANSNRAHIDEARGGKITYGGPFFVHTFNKLVPDSMFAEHPEWFSEIDGKRIGGPGVRSQLCLTNQALKDYAVNQVLSWIEAHPDAEIFSLSQNDWDHHCRCAECMKLEEYEGSPSGPLLHFVNYVAERVGKKYPNVAIDTLAYHYTRKPPRHVRPLPNVIVRLCSIECNFLQPLDSEFNKDFGDDIRGWSKICDRLYVWDYTTNFGHYIQPHPNLRVLAPNIRFFVENGVKGIFEQGAYQSPGAEFAELKAWMLAKLLWDPYRDPELLIDEFVNGYYGAAGPYIREYINYLHDDALSSGFALRIWSDYAAPYLTLDLMGFAETLFNQAEDAVRDDPELLNRVQVARLPIRYVWAMRWPIFKQQARKRGIAWPGPADYEENCRTFMEVARRNKVTKLSEGKPIDAFETQTISLGRKEPPPPPMTEGLPEDRWVDLQDNLFRLHRPGTCSMLKEDPTASDGVAAMMPGNHVEWAVQQSIAAADPDTNATYKVFASIRVEKTGDDGPAFNAGIYDQDNRKSLAHKAVACKDITTDGWVTYELYTGPLHGDAFIWVAPTNNLENAKAVWVDRFWLIRQ